MLGRGSGPESRPALDSSGRDRDSTTAERGADGRCQRCWSKGRFALFDHTGMFFGRRL